MFNTTFKILALIAFLVTSISLTAQNEAFHGGQGDGFGKNTSGVFDLSNVGYEGNNLSVTVNQSGGQSDPTSVSPVLFTVVFSEAVTDFDGTDVSISGIANPQTINVSGSGTTYTVELSGVSANGEMIVQIPSGGVHNSVGNPNLTSTSTDNSVTYTGLDLSVEINLANGQAALTNATEVHFLVEFSEPVSDFTNSDVNLSGTANANTVNVTGSGTTYDVAVSGMSNNGTVIINIPANGAHNAVGGGNQASVNTQNTINCDFSRPTVGITLANGQSSPSPSPILHFLATFSEAIALLEASDIQLSGTAGATNINITQNGNIYTISVSGMTQGGTVIIAINENVVTDLAGNGNEASINTQNSIEYSNVDFTVEINQAALQNDPTNQSIAIFDITFSRQPADFDISDISIIGNNSAGTSNLTGSGTDYQLSLSDFTADGTVIINIAENTIHDLYNNPNAVSINADNQVTIDTEGPLFEIGLAPGQNNPSNNSLLVFSVVFNENVIGFNSGDVELSGSAGANSVSVSGSGNQYLIEISGMNTNGDVVVNIPGGICYDLAGNINVTSMNTSNRIQYDITRPSVEIKQAVGQEDPAVSLPLNFSLEFSEVLKNFDATKISYGGSSGVYLEVSGSGTSYNVAVNGVSAYETISINMDEGVVSDLAGNFNHASVNTDNSITYAGTTGIQGAESSDGCLISYKQEILYVEFEKSPNRNSELAIYSLNGKLLYSLKQLKQQNEFGVPVNNPLILVRVLNGNQHTSSLIVTN